MVVHQTSKSRFLVLGYLSCNRVVSGVGRWTNYQRLSPWLKGGGQGELLDIMYTLHIVYVSYWLKGGEQGDVVAAVLSNSPEYTILFRWVIHCSQRVANPEVWTYSGVAGAGLAMTPINHSFTGPEIAKQVVGPMMGPMRSTCECQKMSNLLFRPDWSGKQQVGHHRLLFQVENFQRS